MKALQFGAGNIGRGFIGKTLSESGFDVTFVDINQKIVNAINYSKEYVVKTVGINKHQITHVKQVTAIHINHPEIFEKIIAADLITTAVGVNALNNIAMIIAKGIVLKVKKQFFKPLNIIACENKMQASSFLKQSVFKLLPEKYHIYLNKHIGFVDCSIDTIIPLVNHDESSLFVMVEEFKEWIVNINQFKGTIPKIVDMQLSDSLNPFIERKLLTLNTGHAIAAYLGLIKKYNTIEETMKDPKIRVIIKNAMKESGSVLIKRFNFNKNDHLDYINKTLLRFDNTFLSDNLQRIGRNPLQKLGTEERLIKPILGSIKYKLSYSNLLKGVAAAFHYFNSNDVESMHIANLIKKDGIENTLINFYNANLTKEVIYSISTAYYEIFKEIY